MREYLIFAKEDKNKLSFFTNGFHKKMNGTDSGELGEDDAENPLFDAIETCNVFLVRRLLSKGYDVNAVHTKTRDTALHFAVKSAHVEIFAEIMHRKPDLSMKNAKGQTAYDVAQELDIFAMATVLWNLGK
jgi:ankyrin repeat protein